MVRLPRRSLKVSYLILFIFPGQLLTVRRPCPRVGRLH